MSALPERFAAATARVSSGILFTLGALGVLRRHFDGFVAAPGASVLGIAATPLVFVVLLIVGLAGIATLRSWTHHIAYLRWSGAGLLALGLIGLAIGGRDAEILALNTRATILCVGLAVLSLAAVLWVRGERATD